MLNKHFANGDDWSTKELEQFGVKSMKTCQASESPSTLKPINSDSKSLFVSRVSSETDEKSLVAYFGQWGEIADIYFNDTKRFAIIKFSRFYDQHPLSQSVHEIDGR